jgi:hypothetical protein
MACTFWRCQQEINLADFAFDGFRTKEFTAFAEVRYVREVVGIRIVRNLPHINRGYDLRTR